METTTPTCTHPDHNANETCEDRAVACSDTCTCCLGAPLAIAPVHAGTYATGYAALHACMANNPQRIDPNDPAWQGLEGTGYMAQVGDDHMVVCDFRPTCVYVEVVREGAYSDSDAPEFWVLQ